MLTRLLRAPVALLAGAILAVTFLCLDNAAFFQGELSRGQQFGRDFLTHWVAAKSAVAGEFSALYSPRQLMRQFPLEMQAVGAYHYFAYSPLILPMLAPLAFLSYAGALTLWSVGGLLAYGCAARAQPGGAPARWHWWLLLAPTTALNLSLGQNGLYTAALLVGGLSLLDRRPLLAGVLFGMLTFKPHLGLLLPLVLIAGGYWRTVATATATTLLLAGVSATLFGGAAWQAWFANAPWTYAREFLESGSGAGIFMQVSPFISARLLWDHLALAWCVQLIATLCAVVVSVNAFRRKCTNEHRAAIVVAATLLATPYVHNYDMAALSLVLLPLIYAMRGDARAVHAPSILSGALWIVPVVALPLAAVGAPLTPLLIAAWLWIVVRHTEVVQRPVDAQGQ